MNLVTELIIIGILITANAVLALSEMAIVSSRKARLRQRVTKGSRGAESAIRLADSPGRFLATVQVGITLVGILAGTFGGATLAVVIDSQLERIPGLARFSEIIGVAIVVMSITYLSVVFGELVPKRIALTNPEAFASLISRPMTVLSYMATPFVWILEVSSNLFLRLLPRSITDKENVTEEEVKSMLVEGTEAGVFEEVERKMVEGVFRLSDRTAGAVMTPRMQVEWLDVDQPREEILKKLKATPRTRYPVARGNLENMIGIVSAKNLLAKWLTSPLVSIEEEAESPLFVPESTPALDLLEQFRKSSPRIAFVVDEFGSIVGLVTMFDILRGVVGDLHEVSMQRNSMMYQRSDGSWVVDGLMRLDELKDQLKVEVLPGEVSGEYSTIAGYIVERLGRLPANGESIEVDGFRFEVIEMDVNRVHKVVVTVPIKD